MWLYGFPGLANGSPESLNESSAVGIVSVETKTDGMLVNTLEIAEKYIYCRKMIALRIGYNRLIIENSEKES